MSKLNSTSTQLDNHTCPKARVDDLSTTHVGDETVVYDQLTHEASCLNAVMAAVWAGCDGKNNLTDLLGILRQAGFQDASEDIVSLAVNELYEVGLLQELRQFKMSNTHKQGRRNILRALGKSAAVAIPVICTINIQPAIADLSPIACSPEKSACGPGGVGLCIDGVCTGL